MVRGRSGVEGGAAAIDPALRGRERAKKLNISNAWIPLKALNLLGQMHSNFAHRLPPKKERDIGRGGEAVENISNNYNTFTDENKGYFSVGEKKGGMYGHWEAFMDRRLFSRDGLHLSKEGNRFLGWRMAQLIKRAVN
ncbi:hypothetical protein UY3_01927 [Chelonia mydas]|uniref:Uncharacterized protein n=1 Tax=Chelonia mydas TaxID=8469 RepID=M7BSG6_CHEMY|nr:hypothetical protein UY3_01927 [Chelonia mydas]